MKCAWIGKGILQKNYTFPISVTHCKPGQSDEQSWQFLDVMTMASRYSIHVKIKDTALSCKYLVLKN
jgi:hypothetical protein